MLRKTRKAAVAGKFYPLDNETLRNEVEAYIHEASFEPLPGNVVAIIVPHAGYTYSGGVAAHAFKAISANTAIEDVLLVGPSHYIAFPGMGIYPDGVFKTPLGDVQVNSDITEQYVNNYTEVNKRTDVHVKEHALEVELPFMQVALGEKFNIVPIIVGENGEDTISALADIMFSFITENGKPSKKRVIVVSADLSHFHTYDKAETLDRSGLEAIVDINPDLFWERVVNGDTEIDAPGAIYALLNACMRMGKIQAKLLKYATSGDTTGDKNSVVGYSAVAFYNKKGRE